MRGKYSPTVSYAYMTDQSWWDKYAASTGESYPAYDPDGYDSYGYDKNDMDRAGNKEYEYYSNDEGEGIWDGENWAYNRALDEWSFDGTKPVKVNNV